MFYYNIGIIIDLFDDINCIKFIIKRRNLFSSKLYYIYYNQYSNKYSMKLTQNMKPSPRPKQPNFETPTREPHSYPYSSTVSPSAYPSSTQNLNLNLNLSSISSAHRFNQQPGAYSSRSSNSKQLFPYDNDIVYSQVSDRIHQFSGGSLMLHNKDRDGLRDNYEYNRSYDDVNLVK